MRDTREETQSNRASKEEQREKAATGGKEDDEQGTLPESSCLSTKVYIWSTEVRLQGKNTHMPCLPAGPSPALM